MFEVRYIHSRETLPIRQKILRPYQSQEACLYDTDDAEGSFHVGAFHDMKLVSIASFCPWQHEELEGTFHYRLRAMATLPEYRRMGAGKQVVQYAEEILREKGVDILWCQGRTSVTGYYERLGFLPQGDVFDYPPIGPHILLVKNLSGR
ncbi:GNAT family N-acetyltransferase [Proteiniclasticum sp. SCR006]|uniref:GNAT family N-acetyltransferase n=1 Tax=Proteiniclasticum aestuarii TaxID=2817862 RepID=A0A939KGG5_9CLOT|nr:GNAT family N-acetyltransferase [Proteiniclasticum aestuarii]MBO1264404.1 GNAT family N-acetyltransferase [Proteiniclasticum aestuarii]